RPSSAALFFALSKRFSESRIVVRICQSISMKHQYVNPNRGGVVGQFKDFAFRQGGWMPAFAGCRPKMKVSAFTKIEMSSFLGGQDLKRCADPGAMGPFIGRLSCAPLRHSQAFSQTLVIRLAENLTLSSLR